MSRINTIHGQMDEHDLQKQITVTENANEFVLVVEYRQGDELVHRSAAVILKQPSEVATAIVSGLRS